MRSPTPHTLLLACFVAACGGDGGGPVDSGLPADKTGAELSSDEAETLCNAAAENLASQVTEAEQTNAFCVGIGLAFAAQAGGTAAECEQLAKMCRDNPEENGQQPGDMCTLGFELSTCTATVADLEACLTERNEASAEAIRGISCDDIADEPATPAAGPACTKIKTSCPGAA